MNRPRYEHLILHDNVTVERMDDLGEAGWQLIAVTATPAMGVGEPPVKAYFRRLKDEA